MMVCNEAHVIARALRSVRPFIDYWVICDTGSTDTTIMEVLSTMSGVPGQLHRTDWRNFGHNRERALSLARDKADYILIMDADMIANMKAPFKHKLTADCYEIRYEGPLDYSQTMLVSTRHQWRYVGVTHEYIHSDTADSRDALPELTLTHFADGGMRSDKFERDVRLLEEALREDPTDSRNTFYLAQSFYDLGRFAEARPWYEKRSTMRGWDQEGWYALYRRALCMSKSGEPWETVLPAFTDAHNARPSRLEPLYEIVKHYREAGEYQPGYEFATAGLQVPYPSDSLFIDRPIYTHLFLLEFGVCAYGLGRHAEAVWAFNLVLRCAEAEPWAIESALRGQRWAVTALYGPVLDSAETTPPNRILVFVPFYNAGDYLRDAVASLLEQDYAHFEVLFVDDASTDGCASHIPADPRFHVVRNERRQGVAANLRTCLAAHQRLDDIVVCLDGDDRLACADALTRIDRMYREHDCWVMYGQFRYPGGGLGFSQPYASPAEMETHREYFRASHIRTFRAGLFAAIARQDPDFQCLRDEDGSWLQYSADAALMFPLLEMAGFDRVRFQPEVLYLYNDKNPLCQHHTDREEQVRAYDWISRQPRFLRIDSYHHQPTALRQDLGVLPLGAAAGA